MSDGVLWDELDAAFGEAIKLQVANIVWATDAPNKGTLLFVGSPRESVCAMGKAKALGYNVCCTNSDLKSPGVQWAMKHGERWGIVSVYDIDKTCEMAKGWGRIDGVVACATDVGYQVSIISKRIGCKHFIPPSISRLGQNKRNLKAYLARKNSAIAMPQFPNSSTEWVVIKPVDGRGARGVLRVPYKELDKWRPQAVEASPTHTVLVEEWIDGPQVSTESVIWNGVVTFTGMTDRFYHFLDEQAPYVIENGGFGPSVWEGTFHGERIKELVRRVVAMLGIDSGTIKCDVVLNVKDGYTPTLIECAIGRMSGGYMCSHYIPLAYGYDFLAAAFDVACGRAPYEHNIIKRKRHYVCGQYEFNKNNMVMKDRGKFFLAIANTREEAIERQWRISSDRSGYCVDRAVWERAIPQEGFTGYRR